MLNSYPVWKYIMLVLVFIISCLYALPNFYGEDPSVQIIGTRGSDVNKSTIEQIRNILEQQRITSKSITLENNAIMVRLPSQQMQLHVQETLLNTLGKNYVIALSLAPATPTWLTKLGATPIKLGLDLRGGIHFLLEVDTNTVFKKMQEHMIDTLRDDLYNEGISYIRIQKTKNYSNEIHFNNTEVRDKAISWLTLHHTDLVLNPKNYNDLCITWTDKRLRLASEYAVQQNISILRNRVNQLGVNEPLVQRQGTDRIVVELPGIQDIARAKEILGATATLEFRLVNNNIELTAINRGHIPGNSEIKTTRDGQSIVLYKRIILTGDHIIDATTSTDEYNRLQVNISLDSAGGKIMSNFTKNNIGKLIASLFVEYNNSDKKDKNGRTFLVKQEEVINIATIQSRLGNNFRITGISNPYEARQLALLLRAGTLIAPIFSVEERILGPSLGLKNITQGLEACVWGLIASILFMLVWYRTFGLIAIAALIINLILIVGIMSILPNATLTMPGIAGIVLTLAISIDANVLINERIKEELRNNRNIQQAIHYGYQNAFSSIFDANVTMLITAITLYVIGTGSIKGFAITTAIGVITSMFTAIIGTRAIVNLLYGNKYISKLSI